MIHGSVAHADELLLPDIWVVRRTVLDGTTTVMHYRAAVGAVATRIVSFDHRTGEGALSSDEGEGSSNGCGGSSGSSSGTNTGSSNPRDNRNSSNRTRTSTNLLQSVVDSSSGSTDNISSNWKSQVANDDSEGSTSSRVDAGNI